MQVNFEREPIQNQPIDLLRKQSIFYKPGCKRCRTDRLLDNPDEAFGQYYYATLMQFDPDIRELVGDETSRILWKYHPHPTLDHYMRYGAQMQEEQDEAERNAAFMLEGFEDSEESEEERDQQQ